MQNDLHQLHKDVTELVKHCPEKAVAAHNEWTSIVKPRFEIGIYVLLHRAVNRGHKLRYKWFPPLQIEQVPSPHAYSVAQFNDTNVRRVHAIRLIWHCSSLERAVLPQEILELADQTTAKFETVDRFGDIAENADQTIMAPVCCDGLPN